VLFIFGTPLYGLLFYGLPGWSQLHTPFRWMFPLTISISVLAGMGWQVIEEQRLLRGAPSRFALPYWLGWLTLGSGIIGLLILAAIWIAPAPWIRQAAKILDRSQLTQWAFGGSATLFLSYQWANFLHLGLALLGAGITILLALRPSRPPFLPLLALSLLLLDLTAAAYGFMPTTPIEVADFTPPSIEWLTEQHQAGAWRYTALEKDWKVLNANSGMQYGLEDVRGYDSIILKHYVNFMRAVSPQPQLDFNRVAPLRSEAELLPDQELLDLLNIRYIVTDQVLRWPSWSLVYEDEVRIYENDDVLPRAFLLGNGTYWGLRSQEIAPEALQALKPREELYLQGDEGNMLARDLLRSEMPFTPVDITLYTPNEIKMTMVPPTGTWLVLSDVDYAGWRAFSLPEGAENERELPVMRANGAFRAVWVEAGEQTIRWRYAPNSVRSGFFASFLGVALLGLGAAYWAWGYVYQEQESEANDALPSEGTVRRVAKNSFAPMALQLFNKAVDTVFAAFMARLLGPESLGQYAFAIALIWYFIIFSNFGLGTLLTRDVARDYQATTKLFKTTLLLRVALYLIAFPLLLLLLWFWPSGLGSLEPETSWAILLLAIGLIPSNISDAITALFRAYEKFEIPALISTISTFVKVSIGAALLLAGYGIVGLAATSIVTNIVTLIILSLLMVRTIYRPTLAIERLSWRQMLHEALPLMINEFLAVAFFRIDQLMLKPMRGNAEAGYYNVSYKFIDGLLILPSSFTLALFPVMSRYADATGGKNSLLRATVLSLRWMIIISLPLALLTTRYAETIVWLFGGPEYLPESGIALQLLIWFLPFSFINSLLQYVLIAANLQERITRAFVTALLFNLIANYFAIQYFGLYGAAAVTIFSEIALLFPFYRIMLESIGPLPWFTLFSKPLIALALAALPLFALPLPFWAAIPASIVLYAFPLFLLRTFGEEERQLLAKLLPGGRK
jgi:O-antigen/teichoic acid export membrane protein